MGDSISYEDRILPPNRQEPVRLGIRWIGTVEGRGDELAFFAYVRWRCRRAGVRFRPRNVQRWADGKPVERFDWPPVDCRDKQLDLL